MVETLRFPQGLFPSDVNPTPTHASGCSSSIRLLELSSGKRARKLSAGHAGSVNQLEFSADGRYLVSSAASSRFANVFDVAGEDATSEPVATLGFAAAPAFLALHCSPPGDGNKRDQLTVVGGTDDGGVSVLRTRRQGGGKSEFPRFTGLGRRWRLRYDASKPAMTLK